MYENEILVDLIENVFGKCKKHYPSHGQISVDCPICSYDLKGLNKGDGKGNLEINYAQHVFKCWVCGETHNTKGHLGYLIDRFGKKKDKEMYDLIRPDEFKPIDKKYEKLKLPKEYHNIFDEVYSSIMDGKHITPFSGSQITEADNHGNHKAATIMRY